ncbi:hypothetical protein GCM10017557_59990 [Streptomyces aurantiacus]|uniref:Uncharacterized protein n=1 Tax=Streptomyces aurantiacus TaxID=47760 RepID=A0A7G1PBK1_9ACTN|nr:hypothetical protein GCM10017557_59990 [Streptomyces aurantiacus]
MGGWAQRPDGEITWRLLDTEGVESTEGAEGTDSGSRSAEARDAIEAEAVRLRSWMGPTRVTPRFRTPLERELASA